MKRKKRRAAEPDTAGQSGWSSLTFAFLAVERLSDVFLSAGFAENPGSVRHRRLMPYMLSVAACQIRDPIAILILMISNDRLVHSQYFHSQYY